MRDEIDSLCQRYLGRLPDLEAPKGYNDKIQWLKLHDQRKEQITACDKWAVRQMVPPVLLIPAELGVSRQWPLRVLKCTHDSGSVRMVKSEAEEQSALALFGPRLARQYGVGKGEWAYRHIAPQVMTEKALGRNVTDYKFHCVHGQVRWAQVIADRANKPRETILDPQGNVMALHMDEKMIHAPDAAAYPGPIAWRALRNVAEALARPWRYVRVDLYWHEGRVFFGELTFWPRAGCYRSNDEPVFGEMLDIDLTVRLDPVC